MKKTGAFLLLFSILVCCVCGCTNGNATPDCVKLCEYRSLEVPEEEYRVSEDDLSTAIQLHLDSMNLEASELTDEIAAEYFNCEDAQAAKVKIKREIIENRFCEAAVDMIYETSEIIAYPESSEAYVDRLVALQRTYAEAEGVSLEAYLSKAYEMDEKSFREAALWGYADYLILEAIAAKEGYVIPAGDRNREIEQAAVATDMSAAQVRDLYGEEFFNTILYEDFLKSLLLENYEGLITAAAAQ